MQSSLPIIDKLKINRDLLNEHHLLSLFYKFYGEENLKDDYKKQWIYNSLLQEEIKTISRHATGNAVLLKGAHLLESIYTDIGSRFLSDIDLLIDPKDQLKWEHTLKTCGFELRKEKKFQANHFKQNWFKFKEESEINIELHSKLFFHTENENWSTVESPYPNLSFLSNEDLIVHLTGHLAFQHTFSNLYWLFDLYFLLSKIEVDWTIIHRRCKELELEKSLDMCLYLLNEYFQLKSNRNKRNYPALTEEFLLYPNRNRLKYILMKHAVKDRLATALQYDLNWFFHYKVQRAGSK